MFARAAVALAAFFLAGCLVAPQAPVPRANSEALVNARATAANGSAWAEECTDWDEWDKRAEPFRVHGDTYHVGTCGITAILVAGPQGHVLLDTGTRNGARVVLSNIRTLGFQPENVQVILTSHEHYDHVGGIWWLNQNSGARVLTSVEAEPVIRTGEASAFDPQVGMHDSMTPIDRRLIATVTPGTAVEVAGLSFNAVATPGHTPGALTWQWESCEDSECKTIVYADSLSPVSSDDYRFSDHPQYVQAYRDGLARLAALDCDILLTPHPSASHMRDKLLAGDLASGMGCAVYAADRLAALEARLAREAGE